jgi:toxin ParE1/3/4
MARILRRPAARDDLVAIWAYIAADSIHYADDTIDRIEQRLQTLADGPLMGRARPELRDRLRSFVIGNYVAFYEPLDDGIDVIRVLHGARDAAAELSRR